MQRPKEAQEQGDHHAIMRDGGMSRTRPLAVNATFGKQAVRMAADLGVREPHSCRYEMIVGPQAVARCLEGRWLQDVLMFIGGV